MELARTSGATSGASIFRGHRAEFATDSGKGSIGQVFSPSVVSEVVSHGLARERDRKRERDIYI